MKFEWERLFTPRVWAGAVALASLLLILTFLWIEWSAPPSPNLAGMLAVVTSLPAPSSTPEPEATRTYDPYAPTPTPTVGPGEIAPGAYVQISGTQGEGLRIRSNPGLDGEQLFLGFDTEVYTVVAGPREVDGYLWYQLAAINDQTRVGWAASNYLTAIPQP
jgi:hypothetical protein